MSSSSSLATMAGCYDDDFDDAHDDGDACELVICAKYPSSLFLAHENEKMTPTLEDGCNAAAVLTEPKLAVTVGRGTASRKGKGWEQE